MGYITVRVVSLEVYRHAIFYIEILFTNLNGINRNKYFKHLKIQVNSNCIDYWDQINQYFQQ